MTESHEHDEITRTNLAIAKLEEQFAEVQPKGQRIREHVDTLREGIVVYLDHTPYSLSDEDTPSAHLFSKFSGPLSWRGATKRLLASEGASPSESRRPPGSLQAHGHAILPLRSSGGTGGDSVSAQIERYNTAIRWMRQAREDVPASHSHDDLGTRRRELVEAWLKRAPAEMRTRLRVDLDYVLERLDLIYERPQAEIWMESHNYYLDARPVDVLHVRGTAEVIAAIEAEEEGSY